MIQVQPIKMGFKGMESSESKKNVGAINYYPEFVAGDGTILRFYVKDKQNALVKKLQGLKVIDLFADKKDLYMVHMSITTFNNRMNVNLEGVDEIGN